MKTRGQKLGNAKTRGQINYPPLARLRQHALLAGRIKLRDTLTKLNPLRNTFKYKYEF